MSEKSKKQTAILHSARELFKQDGFKKVSIEEICEHAGASKMTFYKFFENKHNIAETILQEIVKEGVTLYKEIMKAPSDFQEKLKKIIEMKHEQQSKVGDRFLNDILTDPHLIDQLQKLSAQNLNLSLEVFNVGKQEQVFRKDLTPEYFSYLLDLLTRMYQEARFVQIFPEMHQRTEEIMNLLFYGISRPENFQQTNGDNK